MITSGRIAAAAVVLGSALACGSFSEGAPASTPDASASDAGSTTDGDVTIPAPDGATSLPDAAASSGWCAAHSTAIFCADFERTMLPAGFYDRFEKGDPIALALTPAPDRRLSVVLPNGSTESAHYVYEPIHLPIAFEVSFELSATTTFDTQYVEIVDVTVNATSARLIAALQDGHVRVILNAPSLVQDLEPLDVGPIPTTPTRFSMGLAGTTLTAWRNDTEKFTMPVGLAGSAIQGPSKLSVGVYYVSPPKDGAFQIDDVLVVAQ